ncbi:hypothetical protein ElyMa_001740400 [Elysia marginata]|uniref:Uncharacterized protein n=1 Tax=Elysia marginata TaxID=1093978 RepID=A0AAV4K2M3_9GAST|nr:hypothetical protein ElyMa_001740400 [Elysia marginata]
MVHPRLIFNSAIKILLRNYFGLSRYGEYSRWTNPAKSSNEQSNTSGRPDSYVGWCPASANNLIADPRSHQSSLCPSPLPLQPVTHYLEAARSSTHVCSTRPGCSYGTGSDTTIVEALFYSWTPKICPASSSSHSFR